MIKIGNIIDVYDVQNAPERGARLVVQPDYYNAAFRSTPTFEQDFITESDALNFFFAELGKAFFGTCEIADFVAIVKGGTFYVDIINSYATRKSFRVDNTKGE